MIHDCTIYDKWTPFKDLQDPHKKDPERILICSTVLLNNFFNTRPYLIDIWHLKGWWSVKGFMVRKTKALTFRCTTNQQREQEQLGSGLLGATQLSRADMMISFSLPMALSNSKHRERGQLTLVIRWGWPQLNQVDMDDVPLPAVRHSQTRQWGQLELPMVCILWSHRRALYMWEYVGPNTRRFLIDVFGLERVWVKNK